MKSLIEKDVLVAACALNELGNHPRQAFERWREASRQALFDDEKRSEFQRQRKEGVSQARRTLRDRLRQLLQID